MECPEWAVPFYATGGTVDGKPHWAVLLTGAVPIKIRKLVGELVRANSISGNASMPIVADEWWKEVAHPVYGITPRYHERYEGINKSAKAIKFDKLKCSEDDEVSDEAFVKAAWKRSAIADLATFKAVWIAITQEMPRWMVGDLRHVDFGFGQLHAFPYRANWKQIVLSRFPNALRRLRDKELRKSAEETELPALLRNVVNCAIESQGPVSSFQWTLEVTPNPEWFAYTRNVEADRAKLVNRHGYTTSWGSIITRLYPKILSVFHRFVAQTALPAGALSKGDGPGGSYLLPYTGNRRGTPVGVDLCQVDPVTAGGDELVDDRGRRALVVKAKNVQSLPVLQFKSKNLRDSRGDISRIEWQGGDENGLLVQVSRVGEGQKEDVLVTGHGCGGNGMGRVEIETPPTDGGAPIG
jgi:hypothetical protein